MALVALSSLRFLQSNEKASLEEAGFVAFGPVRCNVIHTLPTFALVHGSPLRAQMTRLRKLCLVTVKFVLLNINHGDFALSALVLGRFALFVKNLFW